MEQGHRSRRKPSRTRPNGHGERRKPAATSPTPKRSPGPDQLTKPAAASPPRRAPGWTEPPSPGAGDGSWLILDRFVHLSRRRRGVVAGDATASSLAEPPRSAPAVRASLQIADPPAVSRLYLHWSSRPQIRGFGKPVAIAAHRNSILFRMSVPFEDSTWWTEVYSFPLVYLVYSCSSSSSSSPPAPSLTALPPCFDGGKTDPLFDKYFQPYRRQQQRFIFDESMGILCHGDNGEFTVADLTYRYRQEVDFCLLHHPPSAGIPLKWSVNRLQIPLEMKIDLYSWMTDVVVPIGQPEQLNSAATPLHQALKSRRLYIIDDPGAPDPFGRVCVTDAGIIKLVCILTKHPPHYGKAKNC
uniref:DUF1618 domain-containing protein n=1 Tax=Setaria viridis TaxID=4556 RepID=A0A4U6TLJ8_SETVI|nr:LOW QUALITY PROTEIN: hypothetical protein SEVIR_8G256300v2 [Setaria viridis]